MFVCETDMNDVDALFEIISCEIFQAHHVYSFIGGFTFTTSRHTSSDIRYTNSMNMILMNIFTNKYFVHLYVIGH